MSTQSTQLEPVMRVTRFDQVSSWLIALVGALILAVFALLVIWSSINPYTVRGPIPLEIVEISGGVEDGSPDETFRLDNEGPESELATLSENGAPEPEVEATLDNVMDVADEATDQADRQFEFQTRDAGIKGKATGNGRRALGMGPGKGGMPREQRWFVSYNENETMQEYGRQLEFFGIELGMLTNDGKLIYLSKLTQPRPVSRTALSGKDEGRLYMTWQGGARRRADMQLFQAAGVDPGNNVLLQFYPRAVEQQLARLELDYKRRPVTEIRRTYFTSRRKDDGKSYEFVVTNQTYFQKIK